MKLLNLFLFANLILISVSFGQKRTEELVKDKEHYQEYIEIAYDVLTLIERDEKAILKKKYLRGWSKIEFSILNFENNFQDAKQLFINNGKPLKKDAVVYAIINHFSDQIVVGTEVVFNLEILKLEKPRFIRIYFQLEGKDKIKVLNIQVDRFLSEEEMEVFDNLLKEMGLEIDELEIDD